MNLLAELLSSRIRAEVFRCLFGIQSDASYHMREIERRTGFAIGTVQKELKKLQRLDIIIRLKDGNRVYYRANTSHPLYSSIHELVIKTAGLADVLKEAIGPEREIKIAFVFGSWARQEDKAHSDVDLMVIGEIGLRRLSELLTDVSLKVGREINPHIFSEKEFIKRKQTGDHFLNQVLASPKIFIIGTENELENLA